jgi:hypothetical protein
VETPWKKPSPPFFVEYPLYFLHSPVHNNSFISNGFFSSFTFFSFYYHYC